MSTCSEGARAGLHLGALAEHVAGSAVHGKVGADVNACARGRAQDALVQGRDLGHCAAQGLCRIGTCTHT